MTKSTIARAAITAAVLWLAAPGPASAILIDDFTDNDVSLVTPENGQASAVVNSATALGGEREMVLTASGGWAAIIPDVEGILQIQSGGATSTLLLTYDGDEPDATALSNFNATGLGGMDLSDGQFELRTHASGPFSATFRVFTDAENSSVASVTLTPGTSGTFETFFVSADDFVGTADLSNVGALQIEFQTEGECSLTYDFIQTGSVSVIPEPSSLALLGVGALGFFGCRHRRKGATRSVT